MLTLIQIVELLLNMTRKVRTRVNESLDAEEQTFARFKMNTHRPKSNFEFDNLALGYFFFFIMWVIRNNAGTSFWILCAMRGTKNTSWSSVLRYEFQQLVLDVKDVYRTTDLDCLGHWNVVLGIDSFGQSLPRHIDML